LASTFFHIYVAGQFSLAAEYFLKMALVAQAPLVRVSAASGAPGIIHVQQGEIGMPSSLAK